jgi:DNA-binding transcriptional ArsR family regulator
MRTTTPDGIAHPALEDIELASVLHALSDPVRLQIVAGLARGDERTCASFELPVTKSTCTHHFKVLREAGVRSARRASTRCAARISTRASPGCWTPCWRPPDRGRGIVPPAYWSA